MKRPQFFSAFVILFTVLCIAVQSCSHEINDDKSASIKVALREAGNQLLLKQKDSTSLILPVVDTNRNTFKLSFQQHLSFKPNDLVISVDSSFAIAGLSRNYRVEVLQCSDGEVAYSYEMNMEEERTLIPCAGRKLLKNCYTIEVKFLDEQQGSSNTNVLLYLLALGMLLLVAIIYYRKRKKEAKSSEDHNSSFSKIGSFQFYPEQNKLVKAATEISLSKKECELLEIFVANPNQVVKRDELTKKVWEDNGVIVGRSLDTYISKLRKILKDDERIKIVNVHGVGYKLEIS